MLELGNFLINLKITFYLRKGGIVMYAHSEQGTGYSQGKDALYNGGSQESSRCLALYE